MVISVCLEGVLEISKILFIAWEIRVIGYDVFVGLRMMEGVLGMWVIMSIREWRCKDCDLNIKTVNIKSM